MQKQQHYLTELVLVSLGGGVGGSLRYLLHFVPGIGPLPVMTMVINWSGTFLLACLGAYLAQRASRLANWQTFIGTGMIGGYTTFSTMILQYFQLTAAHIAWALGYLLLTIVGGLICLRFGSWCGRWLAGVQ
ncbi:CrcB family protein [Leuconostoc lactis]|uniref:fluoride efflux transporter FluC n=1 Tax=Leuconostoc lactis TaxID=1246 RepID=UPI0011BBECB0|nr:CrcB family protein [Leuconostoc lactis]QEA47152.1 CrcB family protein [Leuconostoc lactis]